jgi:hypothetical protein
VLCKLRHQHGTSANFFIIMQLNLTQHVLIGMGSGGRRV